MEFEKNPIKIRFNLHITPKVFCGNLFSNIPTVDLLHSPTVFQLDTSLHEDTGAGKGTVEEV